MQVRSACPSGDYLSVGFSLNRGCTSFTPTWWRPPLPKRELVDRVGSDCQISLMGIIITIIKIIIIILIINGTRGLRLSNISGGHNALHCGRRRWSGTSLNYLLLCATISTCTWYNTCSVLQYILNRHSRAGAITTHCKVHMVHRNTLQTHQVH